METKDRAAEGRARYDLDLIKHDAERLLAAYLNAPGKVSGTRLLWTCPRCGKEKLSLQRAKGAVGCMNAACEVPEKADAIKLIAHLEGLSTRGEDFLKVCTLSYRLLGLADPRDPEGGAHREAECAAQEPRPAPPPLPEEPPLADAETISRVLGRLLELCPLEERDVGYLAGRGIAEATARAGRLGSISAERAAHVVPRLEREFGREVLLGVPGFRETRKGAQLGWTLWGDYILIPYHDRHGNVTTIEGRAATDEQAKRTKKKYLSLRRSGNHLYVHPSFSPDELVGFCEGVMGALAAAQEGIAVGSIQGVKKYHAAGEDAPLPELVGVDFAGRGLLYIPDLDVKPQAREDVEKHAPLAAEHLIRRQNGVPRIARLPEGAGVKDLDEWILATPEAGANGILSRLLERSVSPDRWPAAPEPTPQPTGEASEPLAGAHEARPDPAPERRVPEVQAAGDDDDPPPEQQPSPEEETSREHGDGSDEEAGKEDPCAEAEHRADEPGTSPADPSERWYAVLDGRPGARALVAAPDVYRAANDDDRVPSAAVAEAPEIQWCAVLGLTAATVFWLAVGLLDGWVAGERARLPELPEPLAVGSGIPVALAFGFFVAAAILLHLRARRLAERAHLLGRKK